MRIRDWLLRPYYWWKKKRKKQLQHKTASRQQETTENRGLLHGAEQDRVIKPTRQFDRAPFRPTVPLRRKPLSDIPAVRKMRHGHQAPWYRQTVLAHKSPDEPKDN